VGSNPISRFFENPLHVGGLVRLRTPKPNQPSTHIASILELVAKMTRMCGDFGQFRLALGLQTRWWAGGDVPLPYGPEANHRRSKPDARLPSIRGTRVTVSAVLGQLATGSSVDELLADYPYLECEDVLAALEYAAVAAQEREMAVIAPA
jgi:uncharacterized protein (DUF433 family)